VDGHFRLSFDIAAILVVGFKTRRIAMLETAFATAYELHDLANGHIANSSDDINRLLALFTAYLITAYRAGAELTRLQVSIINVGFLALVAAFSFSATSEALEAVRLWDMAEGRSGEGIHTVELIVAYTLPVGLVALFAAFSFMWSVRHAETK
jgi:hypothetical protein